MHRPPDDLVALLARRHKIPAPGNWAALPGGQTNRCWRVAAGSETWVVKLFDGDAGNPLFPNSARDEAQMLRLLSPRGLAPRLIDEVGTPRGPCLIYVHADGVPWHENPAVVGKALSRLHRQDAPAGLRQLKGGSDRLITQTEDIIARLPERERERFRSLQPEGSVTAAGSVALLHGDPVPGNVIVAGQRITLIDWQCPAIGDPVEDLAIFLSPAMQRIYRGRPLSEAEKSAFIGAYGGHGIQDRIGSLAAWYHWRMAAYCTWKAAQGCREYEEAAALEIAALTA